MNDLIVETADGIMLIILNRPKHRNSVNRAIAEQIAAAIAELDDNKETMAGILTGAGGTFCAGMDLKAFIEGENPIIKGRGFGGITDRPPCKPLIGAIEGYALAGGLEMALACDIIVASECAKFGIPEVCVGLTPGSALLRLPRQMPKRIAMEMAITGEPISAHVAREFGFVNRVVEAGQAFLVHLSATYTELKSAI